MRQPGFSRTTVRFGVFEVDLANSELRKHGMRLRLQEQPFQVLLALLEHPGKVITRDELIRRLWPDETNVDFDRGVNAAVTRLRQALSDSAETPRYVETLPRRGYRFLAPVEIVGGPILAEEQAPPLNSTPSALLPQKLAARRGWWITILATVVLASAALSLFFFRPRPESKLEQITRDPNLATDPAFSPDGKLLAYASDRGSQSLHIWVKQIVSDGQAIQLTRDAWDDHQPSFSPDGSRIAYRSEREGGGIYAIPTIGGEPVPLAPRGKNPVFSPDGKWISYWVGGVMGSMPEADASGNVFVMAASGGKPNRIGQNLPGAGFPVWSPDSKQLLVYSNSRLGPSGAEADWWIVPIDGGSARKTGAYAALKAQGFSLPSSSNLPRAWVWADDTVTFSAQKGDTRNIWKTRFKAGEISGVSERLTQGTTLEVYPSSTALGSLAFASLSQSLAIWALPVDAYSGKVTGTLQRVTEGDTLEATPSISADGRLIAYGSTLPGREDIWLKNLNTGKKTAIASTAASEWHPVISRDGSMVVYSVEDARVSATYVVPAAGGTPRRAGTGGGWVFDWTPNAQGLLYRSTGSDPDLQRLDLQSGVVSSFLAKSGANLFQSKFSLDGEWVAFEAVIASGANGNRDSQLFVVGIRNGSPLPEKDWILVSDEHGWADKPRWSPDGNILYYVSYRDGFLCIWAQRLHPATKRPIGTPAPIYHFHDNRLSPKNIGLGTLEMDVAKDKIVINLGELTGNIWSISQR